MNPRLSMEPSRIEDALSALGELLARNLVTTGVHTINVEQNLGIQGLREYKERQRSVAMLRKYTVRPART